MIDDEGAGDRLLAALARHTHSHESVSDCPLVAGNAASLLPSGAEAIGAIFKAIAGATSHIHLEYYTFADVHACGTTITDMLVRKMAEGVSVALTYDAVGSGDTPDEIFGRLGAAGAVLLEFRSLNPLRQRFSLLRLNDRDHRKLLVVDGRVAVLGGVNMSRVYENPLAATPPADPDKAFWYDSGVLLEGPIVAEVQKLFFHTWERQGGDPLPELEYFPSLPSSGVLTVRADGSAPRERRQLYFESLRAALISAESHILLATGYFVPTRGEWQLIAAAAERGVHVDLLLAGYSDVPACVHAGRALYGHLLAAGVHIHELEDGVLHAKVATIDGVWSAIGSSNLDRRSYVYNNEIDAIVLGPDMAVAVEAMLRGWLARSHLITQAEWDRRKFRERTGELAARVWSRYM